MISSAALDELAAALDGLRFDLPRPDQGVLRERRDRLVREVAGLALRAFHAGAPLLVVLGGGTGAGKSTLANSIAGRAVTEVGVLRPTTSVPTLLHHPADADWFAGDQVLPGLPRLHAQPGGGQARSGNHAALRLVPVETLPAGIAVLDAPDIDSVSTTNRQLAEQLLDAADVWVWCTTARTYADDASMEYLRRAGRRATALAVALTQVEPDDLAEVEADLRAKLAAVGLSGGTLFTVPYLRGAGTILPPEMVAPLRRWIHELAPREARDRLRRQTLSGAVADLPVDVEPLLDAHGQDRQTVRRLLGEADLAYDQVPRRFSAALGERLPLRAEVLRRWTDFVGTGRFLRLVDSAGSQVRSWLRDALRAGVSAEEQHVRRQVEGEISDALVDLIVRMHDLAAADTAAGWSAVPAGRHCLAEDPQLRRAGERLAEHAERAVTRWRDEVKDLVATQGAARQVQARWISTVVNTGAVSLILAIFISSGGLTGAEAGVAAGAAAANQAILIKVLGQRNLEWLLGEARSRLLDAVAELAREERRRYAVALADIAPQESDADRVRAALQAVVGT